MQLDRREKTVTERDLYTVDETRKRLGGISRKMVYRLLRAGDLSSVLIGRRRLIPNSAIESFVASATTTVPPSVRSTRMARLGQLLAPSVARNR